MSPASSKVVICGAGIAGIAAAYQLAVEHGLDHVTLVDEGNPLSLTSDKSTEAYRNWWPGPDWAMTAFMNRSIDLIEEIARATDNRINLNRRGYVFATSDAGKIPFLETMAKAAEENGGGAARFHDTAQSAYTPSPERGFDSALSGADVITDASLIRRHFPFLAPETVALVHARRAGWLSAQQLGMVMLEAARAHGVQILKGRVVGIDTAGGRVRGVHVEQQGERRTLDATHVVLAAGPMQAEMARMIGVDLPIRAERHFKVSFPDALGGMPRNAPMLIWLDEQQLPWSDEERAALAADEEAQWLLGTFPAGVHGRPDGASATLILFNHHGDAVDPVFPLPEPEYYPEIALRGMSTMVPGLKAYNGKTPRPYIDGGYYMRTQENRPLIGPAPVEGAYISCAYSGFGVMASCAGGELIARYITETELPDYAPAFLLSRYEDAAYNALLERWGDGGQL
ncbi:NAD(P)/FAD-dependent oxidoreductase [Microvirga lenta]|uniref:NAD(P)/FAD-dependent oxidoreductase n=1 Tax=Microvirga lenta TaxID=2881337 RepID=UPI001CFFF188|nr:FAD-binding oxidoreductase [Microvirga lenta]MCB5175232.1 FAD-binding oxidoreductase [Microvirga lenta]